MHVWQVVEGGSASADAFRAYPGIMRSLGVTHDVAHSQNFRDPVTGVHTNSVEGMHSVMKKDSRVQFCRLPSVKAAKVQYLDLVVWRTNVRLTSCGSCVHGTRNECQISNPAVCTSLTNRPWVPPSEDEIVEGEVMEDNMSEESSDVSEEQSVERAEEEPPSDSPEVLMEVDARDAPGPVNEEPPAALPAEDQDHVEEEPQPSPGN